MKNLLAALAFASLAATATAAGPAPIVMVFDVSGSMWGQVKGEAKIVGARRVIGKLADKLPAESELAMIAYGHRRESDCADIELVQPLAKLDAAALKTKVGALQPKGKTPITASIEQALGIAPKGANVIVVTDGLETCGGDPCGAVRAARAKGGEFVLHVVGLDVEKEDVSSLECAAQAGGGLYLPAADAAGLAAALDAAVARPADAPAGALVIGAKRNGQLQDVTVLVKPRSGGLDLGARTYAKADTNPRTIPLANGRYRVTVAPVGIEGAVEQIFEIAIVGGAKVAKDLDFSTGELMLSAKRNGKLADVAYEVFAAGDRKHSVATGRTYDKAESNPAKLALPAGDYEVVYQSVEMSGKPRYEVGKFTVAVGGRVEAAHDVATCDLVIGAMRGLALVDAVVTVKAGGKAIDAARTYKEDATNPRRFVVPPGEYQIEVAEVKGEKRTITLQVKAGGTATRHVDYAEPPR